MEVPTRWKGFLFKRMVSTNWEEQGTKTDFQWNDLGSWQIHPYVSLLCLFSVPGASFWPAPEWNNPLRWCVLFPHGQACPHTQCADVLVDTRAVEKREEVQLKTINSKKGFKCLIKWPCFTLLLRLNSPWSCYVCCHYWMNVTPMSSYQNCYV